MDKKFIFNEKAAIIPATGEAVFKQILTQTGAPGQEAQAKDVEALLSHTQTHVSGTGFSIEVAKTTIITRAPELPLQAGRIEVAHEVPANITDAFNAALQRRSMEGVAVEVMMGAQTPKRPEAKTAASSGIILPARRGIILPGG